MKPFGVAFASGLAAALAASCAGPEPNWRRTIEVYADPGLEHHVDEMRLLVQVYSPQVARLLGTERDAPLRVLLRDGLGEYVDGFTIGRWIVIDPDGDQRSHLVHELVHWHMLGSRWSRLPHVVEEGVCYWIEAHGLARQNHYAHELAPRLPAAFERRESLLRTTAEEYFALPHEEKLDAIALGWYLTSCHGIAGLSEIVDAASGPNEVAERLLDDRFERVDAERLARRPDSETAFESVGWVRSRNRVVFIWQDENGAALSAVPTVLALPAKDLPVPPGTARLTAFEELD